MFRRYVLVDTNGADTLFTTPEDASAYYTQRGWVTLPIVSRAKRAAVLGWQKRTLADVRPEEYLGRNIGIVLGAASNNLVDVDLDCTEASALADSLLPRTCMVHGRASSMRSHRWYVVDEPPATIRFKDPSKDGGTLIELRGNGGQTVVPYSIHPSGERLEWDRWPIEPAAVTLADLRLAVADVAAASLLVKYHPGDGSRHDYALVVAGMVAHLRYAQDYAETLVEAISSAAGDKNARDRRQCVVDTYRRFNEGTEISGTPSLATIVGDIVVTKVRAWLSGRCGTPNVAGSVLTDRLGDFTQYLQYNSKGALCATAANAALILSRDSEFGAPPRSEFGAPPVPGPALGFDEQEQRAVWRRPPPDVVGLNLPSGPVQDHHETYVQAWLQRSTGVDFKQTIGAAIHAAARECCFNPVIDYLEGLSWDGTPRLSLWLSKYLGAASTELNGAIGRWWMISAIARVYQPGCRVDHVMVLEGKQGKKKSTALQVLAGQWYSPGPGQIGSKDGMQSLRGRWIVEMGELEALRGRELATVKKFITDATDIYRPSFARNESKVPRRCVFAGSTNDDLYLHDVSGGRRFWPVEVGTIDIDGLTADRDQLFAEAVVAYEAGEPWWPTTEEQHEELREVQDARYDADAWTDAISDYLDGKVETVVEGQDPLVTTRRGQTTVDAVLTSALLIERGRYGKAEQMRVGAVLRRLGWKRVKARVDGSKPRWVYNRPEDEALP